MRLRSLAADVLEDMLQLDREAAEEAEGPSAPASFGAAAEKLPRVGPCSLQLLRGLHALMDGPLPVMRHRAFMMLRRLGGLPATLFRDIEDEDVGAAGVPALGQSLRDWSGTSRQCGLQGSLPELRLDQPPNAQVCLLWGQGVGSRQCGLQGACQVPDRAWFALDEYSTGAA